MTRRLTRALAVLPALGLLVGGPPAHAGLADRVGATFVLVAEDFVRAFQPVEGLVVGVEGDALYLDLGESRGARVCDRIPFPFEPVCPVHLYLPIKREHWSVSQSLDA